MGEVQLMTGRRASDKWLATMLERMVFNPTQTASIDSRVLKTIRRPRRTKAQLKAAYVKAAEAVRRDHPQWKARRIKVRAHNLVKLYKY